MQYQYVTSELPTAIDLLDDLLGADPPTLETENAAPSAKGNGVETVYEVANSGGHNNGDLDRLPAETGLSLSDLANSPQWVAWRAEERDGKQTKVPYDPAAGGRRRAKSNDPNTWAQRSKAEACAAQIGGGVGVQLGQVRNMADIFIGGVDLDSCRDATGTLAEWASDVVTRFGSYAEVSPSGNGVKVFFRYSAEDVAKISALSGKAGKSFSRGNHTEIALWVKDRYFALTGERLEGAPSDLRPASEEALRWLVESAGPSFVAGLANYATPENACDSSRSGRAFRLAFEVKRQGGNRESFMSALQAQPDLLNWSQDDRQVTRAWERAGGDLDFDELTDLESSRLRFLSPDDCESSPSRGYLIKGIVAPGDVGCIFGAPGAGKSLISPFLGYAVAQGRAAFGMRSRQADVFYVAAEDPHGMRARITALKMEHGDASGFTLVEGVADLLSEDSPDLVALKEAIEARKPALVFLDTLAMSFPGLEENSAEGMGRVVKAARELTAWGAAVILIHHDTKAEGSTPRGHSLLNGALDMALHVQPRDESGIIRGKLTKNRNGTCDRDIAFSIGTVDMGLDEDGDSITVAICRPLSGAAAVKGPKLTSSEKAALSVLLDLERAVLGADLVPETRWREACINGRKVSASDEYDSRKKAFNRAYRALVGHGLVSHLNGHVRTANRDTFSDLEGDAFDA